MIESYYDQLAPYYRYLYLDWEKGVTRQAQALNVIIREYFGDRAQRILDAACGIGTQSIGLAQLGYQVVASDISARELALARQEAEHRSLKIHFIQADMRNLKHSLSDLFDLVIAVDNAIPHLLSEEEILHTFQQFYACTTEEGGCIISVRDYANLDCQNTQFYPRTVHRTSEGVVILFDIWEFDGAYYDFTTYIIEDQGQAGISTHVIRGGRYFCVTIATLERLLQEAGFRQVVVLDQVYHQPVIVGLKRKHK